MELSGDEMRLLGYRVVDMLVEHFERVREKPVTRRTSRADMEQRLRKPPPEQGTDASTLLQQLHIIPSNNE